MTKVYHFVPRNLTGDTLYPLNQLKNKLPDLYEAHAKKYEGRQFLLKATIPSLDCLWNDVLHCSPIHPEIIREKMIKLGRTWRKIECFVIDTQTLNFNAENTVLYFSGKTLKDHTFEAFDRRKLDTMRDLPQKTIVYYQQALANGKPPLLFAHVPHVLHKGHIRVDDMKIIQVD